MAEQFVGPRRAGANLTVNGTSWSTLTTEIEFESNVGQDDVTTFADEPEPQYEQGATANAFRFALRMKDGSAASNPPYPAPQNVPVIQNFGASNTLAFTANFSRLVLRRTVMGVGVLAGQGVVRGAVVKTWTTS
jgi:hypothetical protein